MTRDAESLHAYIYKMWVVWGDLQFTNLIEKAVGLIVKLEAIHVCIIFPVSLPCVVHSKTEVTQNIVFVWCSSVHNTQTHTHKKKMKVFSLCSFNFHRQKRENLSSILLQRPYTWLQNLCNSVWVFPYLLLV